MVGENPRIAVIGLDGADPEVLRRYIAEGRLPVLAGLLRRSREVEVQTEGELLVSSIWPCAASGLSAGSHGIHAFRPLQSGTLEIKEWADYRPPMPFWEKAARAGIRTCVLDAPYYGPPIDTEGLESLRVVEWGSHPHMRSPGSFGPDIIGRLLDRYGPHPCLEEDLLVFTAPEHADVLARLRAAARTRAAIIRDLLDMSQPELLVAVFSELHTAGHQWVNLEVPENRYHDPAVFAALGSPMRHMYEAIDAAVGEVIEHLSPRTTVLLTCLAAHRVTYGAQYLLDELLLRLGMTVPTARGRVQARAVAAWRGLPESRVLHRLPRWVHRVVRRFRDVLAPAGTGPRLALDWSRTRAFALTWADGYLRLNQRGREPRGIVAAGVEREAVLTEIEAALRALRIAGTRKPAVEAVVRTQERFPGAAAAELPDLMVLWNGPFEAVESEALGRIENRDPWLRSAHNNRGGIFAYGPLVASGPPIHGVRDIDIAPTVLQLLGLPAADLDGSPISRLIRTASVSGRVLGDRVAAKSPLS